ncbi:MAG: DNA polymerase III subunit delta [Cyclobacteriaceae bacterium]
MDASISKVLADVRARKFQPVYFLQGEEPYFIDLIADLIENHALSESEKSFNQVVLYGKDANMATVLTHARRFPMMAERQVVIVKEAQQISDLGKEAGNKLLLSYLAQPVPSTILVFCHKHKSLDRRKELGKTIDKLAVTINSKKLYDNQLPDFVSRYLAEIRVNASEEAIHALCDFVGNDLSRLTNEIDKLRITLNAGESIDLDKVIKQVGISREYNIFELQKALIRGDRLKAARIVNYFEANPKANPAIPMVAYLFSFFSKLLVASQAHDKSKNAIVNLLKISPFAYNDYSIALQQFSTSKIASNIMTLKEADLKLKGVDAGSISQGQLLHELVVKLML